ncbi:MAG: hypothetical protein AAGN35_16620 [Bacteroidota bacterium]
MRHLIFIFVLLAGLGCQSSDSSEYSSVDQISEREEAVVIYPTASGKSFFNSYRSAHTLIDTEAGRVLAKGKIGNRRLLLEDTVRIQVFRNGTLYYRLKSPGAVTIAPYREFDFLGITNIELAKGEAIEIEQLSWTQNAIIPGKRAFHASGFVQIMNQQMIVEGVGFHAGASLEPFAVDSVISMIDLTPLP